MNCNTSLRTTSSKRKLIPAYNTQTSLALILCVIFVYCWSAYSRAQWRYRVSSLNVHCVLLIDYCTTIWTNIARWYCQCFLMLVIKEHLFGSEILWFELYIYLSVSVWVCGWCAVGLVVFLITTNDKEKYILKSTSIRDCERLYLCVFCLYRIRIDVDNSAPNTLCDVRCRITFTSLIDIHSYFYSSIRWLCLSAAYTH